MYQFTQVYGAIKGWCTAFTIYYVYRSVAIVSASTVQC